MLRAILLAFHCQMIDFGSTNPNWPFFRIHLYTFIFSSRIWTIPVSVSGTDIVFLLCSSADFAIAKMKLRLFDFESENSALKRADRSQLTVFLHREHSQPRVWSGHLIRKLNCVVYKQVQTLLLLLCAQLLPNWPCCLSFLCWHDKADFVFSCGPIVYSGPEFDRSGELVLYASITFQGKHFYWSLNIRPIHIWACTFTFCLGYATNCAS